MRLWIYERDRPQKDAAMSQFFIGCARYRVWRYFESPSMSMDIWNGSQMHTAQCPCVRGQQLPVLSYRRPNRYKGGCILPCLSARHQLALPSIDLTVTPISTMTMFKSSNTLVLRNCSCRCLIRAHHRTQVHFRSRR